ncbi:hypothetical protein KBX17_08585 [Corynebacterium sp. CCUG 65737]|uniref:hypothetical protein n=1 Tax=Corynebacterium sp. CCUG 65737 TaxID=2823889 RepID=UPI00210D0E54|nr:hypothetical protein [Corynebacterium sp. CCUG 65737]MCQ4627854.1 hypothetical protein [Corynebacterium sp. CCUG 65737]
MALDPASFDFEGVFSESRLEPFLRHTNDDLAKAKRAYAWNAGIASRYIARTGFVEVGLRNILDESMVALTGFDRWWDASYEDLAPFTQRSVDKTLRQRAFEGAYPRDRFIAKAEFGLWTSLLHQSNAENFTQLANHAFGMKRGHMYDVMDRVRRLRNRAAHHVCLLGDDHLANQALINRALDYIDKDLAVFVAQADDLERLLQSYDSFLAGNCHL